MRIRTIVLVVVVAVILLILAIPVKGYSEWKNEDAKVTLTLTAYCTSLADARAGHFTTSLNYTVESNLHSNYFGYIGYFYSNLMKPAATVETKTPAFPWLHLRVYYGPEFGWEHLEGFLYWNYEYGDHFTTTLTYYVPAGDKVSVNYWAEYELYYGPPDIDIIIET